MDTREMCSVYNEFNPLNVCECMEYSICNLCCAYLCVCVLGHSWGREMSIRMCVLIQHWNCSTRIGVAVCTLFQCVCVCCVFVCVFQFHPNFNAQATTVWEAPSSGRLTCLNIIYYLSGCLCVYVCLGCVRFAVWMCLPSVNLLHFVCVCSLL